MPAPNSRESVGSGAKGLALSIRKLRAAAASRGLASLWARATMRATAAATKGAAKEVPVFSQ